MTWLLSKMKIKSTQAYLQVEEKVQTLWNLDCSYKTLMFWLSHNQHILLVSCVNKMNLIFIKKQWTKDSLFQNIRETKRLETLKHQTNLNQVFKTAKYWEWVGKPSMEEIEKNYLLTEWKIKLNFHLQINYYIWFLFFTF